MSHDCWWTPIQEQKFKSTKKTRILTTVFLNLLEFSFSLYTYLHILYLRCLYFEFRHSTKRQCTHLFLFVIFFFNFLTNSQYNRLTLRYRQLVLIRHSIITLSYNLQAQFIQACIQAARLVKLFLSNKEKIIIYLQFQHL